MKTETPPTRLRDFPVGTPVLLAGVERQLVVILIEQLREKNAALHRVNREIKGLCSDILVLQRQIAALNDALALELAS